MASKYKEMKGWIRKAVDEAETEVLIWTRERFFRKTALNAFLWRDFRLIVMINRVT